MVRYRIQVYVTVELDAENEQDANEVAERLADNLSMPTPRGRGAELTSINVTTKRLGTAAYSG